MVDAALATLASRQCGLFSRVQALQHGADQSLIHRRLRQGRWHQVAPGVYGLPGWPDSWRRRLWLAHLDVGPLSAVSHQAAAALHGFALSPPGPVVLSVVHGDHERPAPAALVHQSRDLVPAHVTTLDALRVTTRVRTLFDLAAVLSAGRLARILEDAHVNRLCSLEEVAALYEALRRRGKPGMRKLGEVLGARGPGYVPPESELERMLVKVLAEGGLPEPCLQYPLPWREAGAGRVDLAYPARRVLIEADGRRWHARMDSMAEDRRRDREALNHGWRPYRFLYEEIRRNPEMVCETVRQALALALL